MQLYELRKRTTKESLPFDDAESSTSNVSTMHAGPPSPAPPPVVPPPPLPHADAISAQGPTTAFRSRSPRRIATRPSAPALEDAGGIGEMEEPY